MGVSAEILIHVPKQRKHITGEPITGILKFRLDKDTKYKCITLSLIGRGICRLDQNHATVERIAVHRVLLDGKVTLCAGSHEYPFELIVPENIPPSVKISSGSIKYHLVLKFKRPELLSWNEVYKSKIEIYPRVDSALSDQPVIAALNKTLCKCFSINREISLEALLDKEYATAGGTRNISFVVTNKSDINFKVRTELICKTNFLIPKRKSKFSKQKVIRSTSSTVDTPKIPENCVSNMANIIPVASDVYTVRHSQILNREYKIRVTLKLPMPHVNASVEIPVFIGEIVEESGEEFGEPIEAPPPYWETMFEDNEKHD